MKYWILFLLAFFIPLHAYAQNRVDFVIKSQSGEPLIGAVVIIQGTPTGSITNAEGSTQLENIPDGEVEFEISYLGYIGQNLTLNFPQDNLKTIQIEMEEGGEELEEVVIFTTRSSRTIIDIPTRIEVITDEELGEKAAMNSSNIGMLLRETTGVQVQQTSLSSGNMSIRIQGLDGRYTQILKDGFPLYGSFAGGLSIMQIPPLDLKQVELVKGSNSTLYGGGAIAGLVNLVSIIPEDAPELNIMLNQTSALGSTGNVFYAQKYGKTGLSIYGSASNQVAYDPDDDGFSNMPKAFSFSLNPKLYYYINPNTELHFGINSTFDNRTGGDMEVLKGKKNDEHTFSEKNLSERYSTQLQFKNSNENRTIVAKNSFSLFNRQLTIPDYQFKGQQLSSFSELLYGLHRNEHSDWQFGTNFYFERFKESASDSFPLRDFTHHTIGAFIQNTTDIGTRFTIESGLRTDYSVEYGFFLLPRVSVLFKANNKLSSRIGGALGYKLPTIFTEDAEKLYFRGIAPISFYPVEPETSTGVNFDINYKTAFFGKMTFSINQMFFITRLKDALVLRETVSQNGFYYESADGDILSSGFETNLKLTYGNVKLFGNYAFIHTELKYDNINNQKPLTPKHNAGFVLFYEVEEKWSIGYELYFTGSQFDETYDAKSEFWTMGFMVMRYFERFSVFINFENFTNVIQSDYEPLVLPPTNNPSFPDIWAPTDGFVFNGGIKIDIL
jgi:iron complex outermembrane receptor protein